MYRVGSVVRTAQGLLILRSDDDNADIGTMVLNDSLETVGRVVDVFGPVERPYVAVTPDDSVHAPALVGSALYAR
ncbi:Gar1/Naf1 family protein [Halomontanus rarus]|uniref:Gar1/Naf1 family protein n=1 Tax=Halomontanus rarus TaxID=3034020 RepID=UPI001A985832